MIIPLMQPWEPDKGPMSPTSLDIVHNVFPLPEGWGPIPELTPYSQSLGAECKGAWSFRSDAGVTNTVAATQTALWKLDIASLAWVLISKLGTDTIANNDFTSDVSWTKGAGCTIAGGAAVMTAVADGIGFKQTQTLTAGRIYRITFTVSGLSAGAVRPAFSGGTPVDGTPVTAPGSYVEHLTAATGNTTFGLIASGTSTLSIDSVTLQLVAGYVGPDNGELWTATIFGTNLYVSNINDPLQMTSTTGVSNFVNAPGSPPQAKFVDTIGDFLFLAHLKIGAQVYPRRWQHSKINAPDNWVIDGSPGASDDQDIPDGGPITALLPMAGSSARILQKDARRGLIFTPQSTTSFQQVDIDASRGCAAPFSAVSLGSDNYFFLTDNGFVMNDEYTSIGAERVDGWFLKQVDPARLYSVKATADPLRKIVWLTYEDPQQARRVLGYNWFLDRWFQSDIEATVFVTTISPGYVLNNLPDVLDAYPSPPLDSSYWQGGIVNFGAFKLDGRMHLFSGDKQSATIETSTQELAEGMGAYVWGAQLIGNLTSFTIQHGTAFTPDQPMAWSSQRMRSDITGIVPFSKDGKWHRFRLNITAGGIGTHVHGIRPFARPSSLA